MNTKSTGRTLESASVGNTAIGHTDDRRDTGHLGAGTSDSRQFEMSTDKDVTHVDDGVGGIGSDKGVGDSQLG